MCTSDAQYAMPMHNVHCLMNVQVHCDALHALAVYNWLCLKGELGHSDA
jgi:hypothetical protein